jgi:hypothetical protein
MRLDYNIKCKPKKVSMSNSHLTKIIKDKIEKINSTKKRIKKKKNVDLKRMMTKLTQKENQIKS